MCSETLTVRFDRRRVEREILADSEDRKIVGDRNGFILTRLLRNFGTRERARAQVAEWIQTGAKNFLFGNPDFSRCPPTFSLPHFSTGHSFHQKAGSIITVTSFTVNKSVSIATASTDSDATGHRASLCSLSSGAGSSDQPDNITTHP